MEKKLGIYICEGCQLGKALELGELSSKMEAELKPVFCKTHAALCSPGGLKMIIKSNQDENLDGSLIAGCGNGTKDEEFRFEDGKSLERVNLREFVAWSMEHRAEDTQMAAEDYLRMGFARLNQLTSVKPYILDKTNEEILVVGGGVSGLKAAIDGSRSGYRIHLLEKTDALGGWAKKWKQQIPFNQPFSEFQTPMVHNLIDEIENDPNISVYLQSEIEGIKGQPGDFNVKVKSPKSIEFRVGSIVIASGWKPYRPESEGFYGLGEIEGVITSTDVEKMVLEDRLSIKESVLFIQCAGSRDEKHLPYCSSVCCGVSLKQAKYIRDKFPDTIIYIIYKDIRTPGFIEDFYKEIQDDPNIIFIKGSVETVEGNDGTIKLGVKDELLGEALSIEVKNVVLATGMLPNSTSDLKLGYRLGEGIPSLKYDFADSHFICFPYESRRTGIYTAGALRMPMDIPSAMEDGSGAMMKAIQMIESAKRGDSVHPRAGDKSYPEIYLDRCTDCKRCTEECPFGTYDETPSGTPLVNPNRCRRCGICLGACPERVINFADFSITQISEMIKSIEVPDEFEEKPRVLVFVCENDALPALEMAARNKLSLNPFVRIIPVRCLGSVNRVWISDALSKGYDGILQIGCKPGDDYQCHFIHGSELNDQRSEIFEETLTTMMLEPERIATEFVEITDYQTIIKHIDNYMEEIDLVGPNPFKDM